jgi:hypothetical protein
VIVSAILLKYRYIAIGDIFSAVSLSIIAILLDSIANNPATLTENIDQRWLVLRLTIPMLDYTQHFACDRNHFTALGIY